MKGEGRGGERYRIEVRKDTEINERELTDNEKKRLGYVGSE